MAKASTKKTGLRRRDKKNIKMLFHGQVLEN